MWGKQEMYHENTDLHSQVIELIQKEEKEGMCLTIYCKSLRYLLKGAAVECPGRPDPHFII